MSIDTQIVAGKAPVPLTVAPWGIYRTSETFNLPDYRDYDGWLNALQD